MDLEIVQVSGCQSFYVKAKVIDRSTGFALEVSMIIGLNIVAGFIILDGNHPYQA